MFIAELNAHTFTASLIINILYQRGTFVTTDESTLKYHYHAKFMSTLGLFLGIIQSMGLDKCIMTCIYWYHPE